MDGNQFCMMDDLFHIVLVNQLLYEYDMTMTDSNILRIKTVKWSLRLFNREIIILQKQFKLFIASLN